MSVLIKNIKQLIQVRKEKVSLLAGSDLNILPILENAFLLIDDDTIVDFGPMDQIGSLSATEEINAEGRVVMPTWYDSHTHIVYAGNRVGEFVDRINGLSYSEIAERGGGILNSAEVLRKTSEDELYEQSLDRIKKIIQLGTGGLEIKSGYGLTVESELKMLRVIKRLKDNLPIPVKATLLAAHAVPKEYKERKSEYLDLIISEILPVVNKENLADFIDIFCEEGYFDIQDTERILSAGLDYGLKGKIHVNQFNSIGGVRVAVK
ncbi:MAG: imidazolonepropionase, partial [Flavobacteriaceae bacterium]|nr:imidazolonepropionase [Flavobacteriaceae bacterium]